MSALLLRLATHRRKRCRARHRCQRLGPRQVSSSPVVVGRVVGAKRASPSRIDLSMGVRIFRLLGACWYPG